MENNLSLSVIIPCYNANSTLPVQLNALAAQKWSKRWELIIVDNGSTDNSMDVASSFADCFQSFKIVDASSRKGAAFARNAGVSVANSNHVAFCDADDEVASGWVAYIGEALERHEVVYGLFRFEKFNDPAVAERSNKAWENGLYHGRFLPGGGSGNLGIHRHVHQAIGGFDELLPRSEDADYYWRLQLSGYKLHFVPEAIVQVRRERVNPSLSNIYHRKKDTVASNYWCFKKYKHLGMIPPPPLSKSAAEWLRLAKGLFRIPFKNRRNRSAWLRQFVHQTGDIVGQVKGRLLTPCKPYHPDKNVI